MRKSTFFVRSFVAAPTKTNLTDSDKEKMVISFFSGDIGHNCHINDHADANDNDEDHDDDDEDDDGGVKAGDDDDVWTQSVEMSTS